MTVLDRPIESLPPITSAEIEEIMNIMESITESDTEELQLMKQLMVTGYGDCGACGCSQADLNMDAHYAHYADYREPQCVSCRYFEKGEHQSFEHPGSPSVCLVAWDDEDEDRVCEQVEISLFMLAEKHECPHFAAKDRK